MNEYDYSRLISIKNLTLAWRRVTTAGNIAYKRYFRDVFYAYELAVDRNIIDLHERLKGNSYEAQSPARIFLPKASGLNRSITLLHLEDQIVLQAVTNILVQRIRPRRLKVERTLVFSNYLESDPMGIFFLEKWQHCYKTYMNRIKSLYGRNYRWIAYFDLAAFYDTISHELLFKTVYSRSSTTPVLATSLIR
jgi:retron-type reverse transcriptase